jgi:hypothetical protein
MRRILKTSATALMLTCMGGNAFAAAANSAGCASFEDMSALRAAAVQQRLMVAAFSCHATDSYNKFVLTYQKDLQASDRALQNFFQRSNAKSGTADYHSFKTRLANVSSMQSIRDTQNYCASAQETFEAAFAPGRKSLALFLASQTTQVDDAFPRCEIRTASTKKPAG